MSKFVYGIDLGTTYSCIAYVDETGRANVINNLEGTNTTPSVVNFAGPTQVVVGQVAKENAVIDPQNTMILVKTLMGVSQFAINCNGEDKSPEEISAYILRKLAEDASKIIDEEVKDVVITCPAYFGTAERVATKNAGQIAGLNVLEIISEPTAAALYYGCTKEQNERTILVYDLGGGTFDVTIMRINSDKIEVICSDGSHRLGGKDWDEAVMKYLVDKFISETGFQGEFDEYAQQELRLKAEKAKQQLTSREEVPVMLDVSGCKARITLSRAVFDDITSVYLNESIEKTDSAIEIVKSKGYTIDEIILVGGSTRMPQVTKKLVEKYGMKPKILEPDEAVAKGAAIHAVNVYVKNQQSMSEWTKKETNLKKEDYKEKLTVNPKNISIGGKSQTVVVATTKSFALGTIVDNKEYKCCNMIIKNEAMTNGSISVSKNFMTREKDQNVAKLVVYESDIMDEYFDEDKDYILGSTLLNLPQNLPQGAPIEVTFTLNSEGILEVKGKDLTGNKEVVAIMQAKGIMANDMVCELKEKSKNVVVM